MRTKDGPLRVLTPVAAAIIMMATCVGCSTNSYDRQMETCTGIGAAIGAMAGGGSGLAIRMYTRGSHRTVGDIPRDNLIGWGVAGGAVGALLGAGIGHAVCQPTTEAPRTVTYYGTQSSTTTSSTTTASGNP